MKVSQTFTVHELMEVMNTDVDLMTPELEKRFKEVGEQLGFVDDPIVIAKYLDKDGIAKFYAVEYYPDEKKFMGFVSRWGVSTGDDRDFWGEFWLKDLEEFFSKEPIDEEDDSEIERDLNWTERPMSKVDPRAHHLYRGQKF